MLVPIREAFKKLASEPHYPHSFALIYYETQRALSGSLDSLFAFAGLKCIQVTSFRRKEKQT